MSVELDSLVNVLVKLVTLILDERDDACTEVARLMEEQRRDLADVDRFRGNLIRADDEIARLRAALEVIASPGTDASYLASDTIAGAK